ncbi:FAD-dependent oxidoreductase [Pseudonocardia alni]|uniref:FAD-dependent oxidoreductase n=1 Tax=Pseudonocardia alni TaxID=33907 RepID=UPI0033243B25
MARSLSRVLADPRVRFVGNVEVGRDVSVDDLRSAYDAVVVATGAPGSRRLGIPGEDLPGSHAAADVVAWYNGHPDAGHPPAAPAPAVAVVGAGNVSLDVARVLLKSGSGLAATDTPSRVEHTLTGLGVLDVHIVVRRGIPDVRFSLAELLEFDRLADVDVLVAAGADGADAADPDPADRTAALRTELFGRWARNRPSGRPKRLHLHFHSTPVALTGDAAVEGIRLVTAGVDEAREVAVQAVVRAIGYRGRALPGLPFDDERGVVPHDRGLVDDGLYVTGWIKRGPSGVIGTNKACAVETVDHLLDRLDERSTADRTPRGDDLIRTLRDRVRIVGWAGWQAIDAAETALGAERGRTRTKITDRDVLLDIGSVSPLPIGGQS